MILTKFVDQKQHGAFSQFYVPPIHRLHHRFDNSTARNGVNKDRNGSGRQECTARTISHMTIQDVEICILKQKLYPSTFEVTEIWL
jgi:hypothetical protein